ncbi:MAG: hypothetical protein KatS3mg115_0937 [Candidatus Poribacteria bacterium]|nr:MAG: hypothetical protein KatS3mg115_0937 [Candidatus Poribacteria bacterium]
MSRRWGLFRVWLSALILLGVGSIGGAEPSAELVRLYGKGLVRLTALAPDGSRLLVAATEKLLLLDRSGDLLDERDDLHRWPIVVLAVSPDGKRLLSADRMGQVRLLWIRDDRIAPAALWRLPEGSLQDGERFEVWWLEDGSVFLRSRRADRTAPGWVLSEGSPPRPSGDSPSAFKAPNEGGVPGRPDRRGAGSRSCSFSIREGTGALSGPRSGVSLGATEP